MHGSGGENDLAPRPAAEGQENPGEPKRGSEGNHMRAGDGIPETTWIGSKSEQAVLMKECGAHTNRGKS